MKWSVFSVGLSLSLWSTVILLAGYLATAVNYHPLRYTYLSGHFIGYLLVVSETDVNAGAKAFNPSNPGIAPRSCHMRKDSRGRHPHGCMIQSETRIGCRLTNL